MPWKDQRCNVPIHLQDRKRGGVWTVEEEDGLFKGVQKYGVGNWRHIIAENSCLDQRTPRDCYDKWRNLNKNDNLEVIRLRLKRT